MDLKSLISSNPFFLAPMAGITDCAFRSYMRELGCGVVVTELVSANGYEYSRERTRTLMKFTEDQHPIGIQIFGERLELLANVAKDVEQMGADFVDLNFGCPVPKVVSRGAGAALLKNLTEMRKVLRTVRAAVQIPVTIKVRTGWDQNTRNADQVVQMAYDEGMSWVAIHGRTRSMGYSGQADWDYIKDIKSRSPLPIIGNGDLTTPEKAVARLLQSGCDGVMIGRGCLKNPSIFLQARALLEKNKLGATGSAAQTENSRSDLAALAITKLVRRLADHLEQHCDERAQALNLKKMTVWYSSGYPQSAQFRRDIFALKEKSAVLDCALNYFDAHRAFTQEDTSGESFLMGGHG